tara:strand:+ start:6517 stop:6846 length:330 start_codon:yes stop_codon:yes gene_type:complete
VKGRHVTIGTVIAVIAGVGGVYGFADEIGFKIDRPAFKSEVTALDERQQQVVGIPLRYVLVIRKRELLEVELAITKYKKAGQVPPIRLIQEREVLQAEIEMIERELKRR